MATDITTLLTIISIVLIVLLTIFIIKGLKKKVDITYFSLAMIIGIVGNIVNSASSLYTISKIGSLLSTLSFFFIFLQYEHIEHEKPDKILYPLFLILNAISFGFLLALFGIVATLSAVDPSVDIMTGRFFSDNDLINVCIIGQISIGLIVSVLELLRSFVVVVKLNKFVKSTKTKMEMIYLFIFVIYRIILIIGITESYFNSNSIFVSIGLLFLIVGIFIALMSYIIYTEDFLRIPFPVHSFMIYNRAGLLVYTRLTHVIRFEKTYDDALISGTYSAVNSIIEEIFGKGVKLRRIITDNYQVYFIEFPSPGGTLVVTSLGSTNLFYQSIKRLVKIIPKQLLEELNESGIDLIVIKPQLDKLIQSTFPYVLFKVEK